MIARDMMTESVTLTLANRISIAARNVVAMIENGLTTSDAIKDNECRNKCHSEDSKATKATGQEYRFVSFHLSLSKATNIASIG